jgi:arginine exporter protein ArgO
VWGCGLWDGEVTLRSDMSIFEEIQKLNRSHIVFAAWAFLSVVAPGFLTIYLYKPLLVGSLDTLKLIVFSAALTLPILILNFYVVIGVPPSENEDHQVSSFIFAMAITFAVFYLSLSISYFALLTFKSYVVLLAVIQVLLFVSMWIDQRYSKKS